MPHNYPLNLAGCLVRIYRHMPLTLLLKSIAYTVLTLQIIWAKDLPINNEMLTKIKHLNEQVEMLYSQGNYTEAIPLAQKTLEAADSSLGSQHPYTAISLVYLAMLYEEVGTYKEAEQMFQRALEIPIKVLGVGHIETILSFNNLATLYEKKGAYGKAEPLFQRVLAIVESKPELEPTYTLVALNRLALLYKQMGNYVKAEPLLQRALTIADSVPETEHSITAATLNNLAMLYGDMGDYVKEEPLLQRALKINENDLSTNPLDTATVLNNLALLYAKLGDYGKAERFYKSTEVILKKEVGPENLIVAEYLNNLAHLYMEMGAYIKAEPHFQRALVIFTNLLGSEHPTTATCQDNLGQLYHRLGHYAKAEQLYKNALAIRKRKLGDDHPDTTISMNNLAMLYMEIGSYGKAESLYKRVLMIRDKVLGSYHPETGFGLFDLAALLWAEGRWPEAHQAFRHSSEILELNTQYILSLGDEARKKAYMGLFNYGGIVTFSLALGPQYKESYALGLEVILQRKGRVLEAMSNSTGLLRQHLSPPDQLLLDQQATLRSQQAMLLFQGLGKLEPVVYRGQVANLEAKADELEAKLSANSAAFRSQQQAVTLQGVQAALPKGSALIDIIVYRPFNPKAGKPEQQWAAPHYAAYVLQASGEPKAMDLGETKALDTFIDTWREGLSNARNGSVAFRGLTIPGANKTLGDPADAARQLYAKVFKPLLPLLGDAKTLFIAPDGALNLIPLGALPDEADHYLLEKYEINYLSSGRDLLKRAYPQNTNQKAVVLANPDFGSSTKPALPALEKLAQSDPSTPNRRSADYNQQEKLTFNALPGTADEAKELKKLLPDGAVLTGPKASETALKALHSPKLLHLATHGFFLPDQALEKSIAQTGTLSLNEQDSKPPSQKENPLLRSGIALAGANQLQSGKDDGILTALEASGLDLWGTQLVVLSACETGIGKVSNGEGVYGLRRALVNAGAESQVMSLWKVDDDATKDLMVDYYRRLLAGESRSEALRQAQLAMINSEDRHHPFFWAAFIASGDTRPLNGLPLKAN